MVCVKYDIIQHFPLKKDKKANVLCHFDEIIQKFDEKLHINVGRIQ